MKRPARQPSRDAAVPREPLPRPPRPAAAAAARRAARRADRRPDADQAGRRGAGSAAARARPLVRRRDRGRARRPRRAEGIRNYKQRLKDLKQKDPFAPAFKPKKAKEPEAAVADAAGSSTAASPTDASSSASHDFVLVLVLVLEHSSVDDELDARSASDGVPSTRILDRVDGDGHRAEVIRFFSAEIDVAIGEPGHREQVEDVRYLDHLPGKATPLLTFLGFGGDTHEAVFPVGRNVTDHSGDGSCAPKKPAACEFLTMKLGDTEKLVYGNQSKAVHDQAPRRARGRGRRPAQGLNRRARRRPAAATAAGRHLA